MFGYMGNTYAVGVCGIKDCTAHMFTSLDFLKNAINTLSKEASPTSYDVQEAANKLEK